MVDSTAILGILSRTLLMILGFHWCQRVVRKTYMCR